jgi:hypothetical protein
MNTHARERFAADWPMIREQVERGLRLSKAEKRHVEGRLAKLIAYTPYVAESTDPERVAVQHLLPFLSDIVHGEGSVFDARESDMERVERRLNFLTTFPDGDERVIDLYVQYLKLIMLYDYREDAAEDAARGKYNPANAGYDIEGMIRKTEKRIAGYQQQLLAQFEDIFPFDGGTETWWAG